MYSSDKASISSTDGLYSIPDSYISKSSVTVSWKPLTNDLSADVYQYYSYHIQYKESGSLTWPTGDIIPYDPDDETPETTIINLTPYTDYDIRVVAIRTVDGKTDESDNPDHTNTRTVSTLPVEGNPFSNFKHGLFTSWAFCLLVNNSNQ